MTQSGLSEHEMALITSAFRQHPDISRVVLFGSRAKGTSRPNSDLDLAIEGIDDVLEIEALASELDELPLPYRFDVQAASRIQHKPLLEHIERVGVVIFDATQSRTP